MQQGLLFHTLYASEASVYSIQWSCTLHGDLHAAAFKRSWQTVMERHPVLRTAFHWTHRQEPFQVVSRSVALPWRQYDWRNVSVAEQQQQVEAFLAEDHAQGFDLSKAPLMRLTLIRVAEDVHQFVWTFHHLLLDGWSLSLLLKEVFQFYETFCVGQELQLAQCQPYSAYIAWLQRQDLEGAERFWRNILRDFTEPTTLHLERPRQTSTSTESDYKEQQLQLSVALTTKLQAFAKRYQLSLNTLVQGAWALLLSRYSGRPDVVFGTIVAGRPTDLSGVESMIGLFINTLPVRVRMSPNMSLLPWLQSLQAQQAEARQYEYSSLVQVQGWSEVERGLSLFDSIFAFENYPQASIQELSVSIKIGSVHFLTRSYYPLTIVVLPESVLRLRIGYHCNRFDATTISRMLKHMQVLLERMVTDAEHYLIELPLLTKEEQRQQLVEWNETSSMYPQDICLHQLFEAQVEYTPEAVAVVFSDQYLTYQALNDRSNQLAHYLQVLGVRAEVLVGICVERSLEMLIGLMGILKAGGVYVVLNPTDGKERLAAMLADAQVSVLLTQHSLELKMPKHKMHVLCLDTDWATLAQESTANVNSQVTSGNLAYILYTSGSTGQPKGVMIEHKSLVNYLSWVNNTLFCEPGHSLPLVTDLIFDASLKQLFCPLLSGGQVWVLPSDTVRDPVALLRALQTRTNVILNCIPSLWEAILDTLASAPMPSLNTRLLGVLFGGERLTKELIDRTRAVLPHVQCWNMYGLTESTVCASAAQIVLSSDITVGRPIANTQLYILDTDLRPLPVGIPGELYVGGINVARGYLNQPALTAERFLPDPVGSRPGARLYKTGDLARFRPDGSIEFLGRADYQVKIRGYRIELEEIEVALQNHPSIRQAIVLAQQDGPDHRRLVAYVVSHRDAAPSLYELRSFLQTQLPDYMIPAAIVRRDAFPLTSSGKVDRRLLAAPDPVRPALAKSFVAPRTPIEEILAGIWETVLGLESVGVHDNFFELGGHSLLAIQVISRIRKTLQVEVSLPVLFDALTVAELALRLHTAREDLPSVFTSPIHSVSRVEPVPMTTTQEHLWRLDRLIPGAPFSNMPYAIHLRGPLNVLTLEQSFNEIIQRHEALRSTFTTVGRKSIQVVSPAMHVPLTVEDLHILPQDEQNVEIQRCIREAVLQPFDLERGPLLQLRLLQLAENNHILLLTIHHIISDGWSMGVLSNELTTLYNAFARGHSSPLAELPVQYADFACWQHQWLHSDAGQAQLVYWTERLHDPLPLLALPSKRPRTEALSWSTAQHFFQLPRPLTQSLMRLSRQEGTTLFMTLMAAFNVLLYGYTGQDDLRVGTLVANRQQQEIEGLIGLFANVIILRTNLEGNPNFRQVLHRVRATTLAAYMHQDMPLEHLVRTLEYKRGFDRQSLFQVMFTMQNAWQRSLRLTSLTIKILETRPVIASTCDMAVTLQEDAQGLHGVCTYKSELFDASCIVQMLDDFRHILGYLTIQPDQPISAFHAPQNFRG